MRSAAPVPQGLSARDRLWADPPVPPIERRRAMDASALRGPHTTNGLIVAALVIAALYFGRDILMPLALAVLLGFVLDPLVTRLKRLGVARNIAVVVVVTSSLAALGLTGLFVASQVTGLGRELPTYQANIQQKFGKFRARLREPGVMDGASRVVEVIEREIGRTQEVLDGGKADARQTSRVQVVPAPRSPMQRVGDWLERFSGPAAMAGLVLIVVVFVLLDRGDLRDRMLRLLGGNLHRTTEALNDAAARVSRYLSMQVVVNASFGAVLTLGLWLIGIPGALLWGVLSGVLRFIPYVGAMVGALFPLMLAFAVDPGWGMLGWTLALIAVLELVSNNVIEPMLYGSSTGLSALSLIVAATFWTSLWGPIGLLLSTPLTVCLLVVGRHLPSLQFLDVLLGNRPALDAPTRLYQRLLAGDVEEAVELAVDGAERDGLQPFYHSVAMPMLQMARNDTATMDSPVHLRRVMTGVQELLDDLEDEFDPDDARDPDGKSSPAAPGAGEPVADANNGLAGTASDDRAVALALPALAAVTHTSQSARRVVHIPGRDVMDLPAARMSAHLLRVQGLASQAVHGAETVLASAPGSRARGEFPEAAGSAASLKLSARDVVCLHLFSPQARLVGRHIARRLRRHWPDVELVVALWSAPRETIQSGDGDAFDAVVTSIDELVAVVRQRTATDAESPVPEGNGAENVPGASTPTDAGNSMAQARESREGAADAAARQPSERDPLAGLAPSIAATNASA